MNSKWETVNELKERTGLCRNTIMKVFDKPGISCRIGRIIRFNSDAVDKVLFEMGNTSGEDEANE